MCNAAPARAASPRGRGDCPEIKGLFGRACSPAPAEADATATATSTAAAGYPWDGGAVWVGRTRREPIHGGSMAPSMAPTVLPTHTAPPLTGSRGCWQVSTLVDTSVRYRNKTGVRSVFRRKTDLTPRDLPADRRKLSKAGWGRLWGCPRHGCRGQAPMDGFTASPTTWPTPPTHRKPAFAVALAVASASAGSGRRPDDYNPAHAEILE